MELLVSQYSFTVWQLKFGQISKRDWQYQSRSNHLTCWRWINCQYQRSSGVMWWVIMMIFADRPNRPCRVWQFCALMDTGSRWPPTPTCLSKQFWRRLHPKKDSNPQSISLSFIRRGLTWAAQSDSQVLNQNPFLNVFTKKNAGLPNNATIEMEKLSEDELEKQSQQEVRRQSA